MEGGRRSLLHLVVVVGDGRAVCLWSLVCGHDDDGSEQEVVTGSDRWQAVEEEVRQALRDVYRFTW